MSKAYDRVEWKFVEAMMIQLGFGRRWITWIMRCVKTVTYSFVINGEPVGNLIPSRGLRQGDAISPYLFLLCAEYLSRLLVMAEQQRQIEGIRICSEAPPITHPFFADNSFIFIRAGFRKFVILRNILRLYEQATGQHVSFEKSSASFSKNVHRSLQDGLAAVLGVKRVEKHLKYLGLPMEVGASKVDAFQYLNE
ncbi:hypothetical protein ACLB2K_059504 [Fragaria x ananassa]